MKFVEKEAVEFGAIKEIPVVTQETELRLRAVDLTSAAGVEEAYEVFADCFPKNKAKIMAFMREHMTTFNLEVLQAFLLGGNQAVEMVISGAVTMGAKNG